MKNCKTLYKVQTASRLKETVQPPPNPFPSDKTLLRLWNKNFLLRRYTEIQKHLLSKSFKNSVLGRQEMVRCKCFMTPNRIIFAGKFAKSERRLSSRKSEY